jgi:hypothetical protein
MASKKTSKSNPPVQKPLSNSHIFFRIDKAAVDLLGVSTVDEVKVRILAYLGSLGIDTEKYPVYFVPETEVKNGYPTGGDDHYPINVFPNGQYSVNGDAFAELRDIPSPFKEQVDRWVESVWDRVERMTEERHRDPAYLIANFKLRIGDLATAQANDPAFAEDALLGTLIATLSEAFQPLAERIQQLRHIEPLKNYSNPVDKPSIPGSVLNVLKCLGYLDKLMARDQTLLIDRELSNAQSKLLDAFHAVVKHLNPPKSET